MEIFATTGGIASTNCYLIADEASKKVVLFDAPDNNLSCPSRERSTTAPQSLTLLNADEVLRAAELTATRIEKENTTPDSRIATAYREILGRLPTAREAELSRAFLATSPLRELCRALFNLNDFLYLN